MYDEYRFHPCPYWDNNPRHHPNHRGGYPIELKDYGPCPFVTNIEEAAKQNDFSVLRYGLGNTYNLH